MVYAQNTATISGIVLYEPTGQPLTGVTVKTLPHSQTVCTDRQGRYSLTVTTGPVVYKVLAQKSDYQTTRIHVAIGDRARNAGGDIAFQRRNTQLRIPPCRQTRFVALPANEIQRYQFVINGVIKDDQGKRVVGARVWTRPESATETTDELGHYVLVKDLRNGTYDVYAEASGYDRARAQTILYGTEIVRRIDMVLYPPEVAEGSGGPRDLDQAPDTAEGGSDPTAGPDETPDTAEGGSTLGPERGDEDQGYRATEAPRTDTQGVRVIGKAPEKAQRSKPIKLAKASASRYRSSIVEMKKHLTDAHATALKMTKPYAKSTATRFQQALLKIKTQARVVSSFAAQAKSAAVAGIAHRINKETDALNKLAQALQPLPANATARLTGLIKHLDRIPVVVSG